jgi:hypothetical protein
MRNKTKFKPAKLAGLNFVYVNIAVHDGVDSEGGDAFEPELIHDILAMRDDCG